LGTHPVSETRAPLVFGIEASRKEPDSGEGKNDAEKRLLTVKKHR
jgi:hypothetical protein